jgi:CheY-like chemotaxis protein
MSKCVLLVEDEGLIRLTLAETLEDAGYTVVEAGSGDEACALLNHKDQFDVLLTDIQMPGSADGIDVARSFHELHPGRPVVFMTGRPDMMGRVGRLEPSEILLRKPFGSAQMLTALETLLVQAAQLGACEAAKKRPPTAQP